MALHRSVLWACRSALVFALPLLFTGCADLGDSFATIPSQEMKSKFDENAAPFTQPDDGTVQAALGKVYDIGFAANWTDSQKRLENFDLNNLSPIAKIAMRNFDIPEVEWEHGFPAATDLQEWFAIVFEGKLEVPFSQGAKMATVSDDGIRLYLQINGVWELIVTSSGLQRSVSNCGAGVLCPVVVKGNRIIPPGNYPFRLEYFQGPRMHIALQMLWLDAGVAVPTNLQSPGPHLQGYSTVPKENIYRP